MDSKSMQPGATPGPSAIFSASSWNSPMPGDREEKKVKPAKKRFYRKRIKLFNVINKIKLWPSRTGKLHGIRTIEVYGETARLVTHCNKEFYVNNSMNSRAGRWLRNKWFTSTCSECRIPEWKLEKYSSTRFKRHQGSLLKEAEPV